MGRNRAVGVVVGYTKGRQWRPIREYVPGDGSINPPEDERPGRDGWGIIEFEDGAKGYTDGHFALKGEPPEGPRASRVPQWGPALKQCRAQGEPFPCEPVSFATDCEEWDFVCFTNGGAMQGVFYDHILSRFPNAKFAAAHGPTKPFFIYNEGAMVGAVMPINVFMDEKEIAAALNP